MTEIKHTYEEDQAITLWQNCVQWLDSLASLPGPARSLLAVFAVLPSPCTMELEVETSQACAIDYSRKL